MIINFKNLRIHFLFHLSLYLDNHNAARYSLTPRMKWKKKQDRLFFLIFKSCSQLSNGHWVVTYSMLLYLDLDTLRTCLVDLRRCLFGVLPDITLFSILSCKTFWLVCWLYIYGPWADVLEKMSARRAVFPSILSPCCVNLGLSPLLCKLCLHYLYCHN